jgi:hypothetical protein
MNVVHLIEWHNFHVEWHFKFWVEKLEKLVPKAGSTVQSNRLTFKVGIWISFSIWIQITIGFSQTLEGRPIYNFHVYQLWPLHVNFLEMCKPTGTHHSEGAESAPGATSRAPVWRHASSTRRRRAPPYHGRPLEFGREPGVRQRSTRLQAASQPRLDLTQASQATHCATSPRVLPESVRPRARRRGPVAATRRSSPQPHHRHQSARGEPNRTPVPHVALVRPHIATGEPPPPPPPPQGLGCEVLGLICELGTCLWWKLSMFLC